MKKFLMILLSLVLLTGVAFAQEISASKVDAAGGETPTIIIGTGAEASTAPQYIDLLVTTTELPVSFVRMATDNGTWSVDGQMSIGASYVIMYGRGKLESDGSVSSYRPFTFFGPVVALGAVADGTTSVSAGVTLGGVVGFGPMSGIFGYDIISKKTVLGLGFKIDVLSISDATTVVLKKFEVKQ